MKTKTIITAVLLLFSLTSFAQTKEETIAWIKEKLEQYGGYDGLYTYTNVSVSACSISFTRKYSSGGESAENFNPSMAKSWKVHRYYIDADPEIIQYTYSDGNKGSSGSLWIRNGELDIHERMIKALTHLATFCDQKKEAF